MKFFSICVLTVALAVPAFLQTSKPKPRPATGRSKPAATPAKRSVSAKPTPKKTDQTAEWDRVTAITDRAERISALEKFITSFPKSDHLNEAAGLIAAASVEAGNDAIAAGDIDGAVLSYKQAALRAPTPVVQGFWDDGLMKIPANLYFRDRRDAAIEIAKTLEAKAAGNVPQLLSVARFYLTVENGSEGKRVAEKAIAVDPNSSAAYRTLGLAERMDFDLEASAAAFSKAVELDPESVEARQGLAEMKRALGKPDEALALYEAVLAKEPDNVGAETGRIMSLFEMDRRPEAEAAMARSLEATPGNVILLAGAAYWYAAHNDASHAIEYAQRSVAQEPRFIWGHIAYARALLLQGRAAEAEAALLGARRYGNFPTLEYELAVARAAGGFYREAAEGLAANFQIKDGLVSTELGNRVNRESRSFTDLVADERRASIFAPSAADDPQNAARLAALLEFERQLSAATPDETAVAKAAEELSSGDDAMRVHRQLYAASRLLEQKIAVSKAVELAKAAVPNVDRGLDVPAAATAVMANELYAPRRLAATRGEYVNVPAVPRTTLSAIVRGRIEDVIGWAAYQNGTMDDAVLHLRRAVGVLPADSAWWRSSTWHLGAALAVAGKDSEALEQYIKSYKADRPDPIRYSVIQALYQKVNGSTQGLAAQIGDDPSQAVAQNVPVTTPEPRATPTPAPTPINSGVPFATPTPEAEVRAIPEPTPVPQTPSDPVNPSPAATPEKVISTPTPSPEAEPIATPAPTPELTPAPSPTPEAAATPTPEAAPAPTPTPEANAATRELFPPVIITIPSATKAKPAPSPTPSADGDTSAKSSGEGAVTSCEISASEESVTLSGGNRAIIVGRSDDGDIDALEATSSSPADVVVRREPINGVKARALYILRAASGKKGVYQVTFALPCGTKVVTVNVR